MMGQDFSRRGKKKRQLNGKPDEEKKNRYPSYRWETPECRKPKKKKEEGSTSKLTDDMIRQAWLLASRFGANQPEMADLFDVSKEAIEKWMQKGREQLAKGNEQGRYARFLIAVKSGDDAFNTEGTEKALAKRARGYSVEETKTEKTRISVKELRKMGIQVPESLVENGEVVYAEKETVTEKEIPPDTQAIMFFLQNRAGNRWKNVKRVEADIKGGVDHRHLHGFVGGGALPAGDDESTQQIDVSKLSDEQLAMIEEIRDTQEEGNNGDNGDGAEEQSRD